MNFFLGILLIIPLSPFQGGIAPAVPQVLVKKGTFELIANEIQQLQLNYRSAGDETPPFKRG